MRKLANADIRQAASSSRASLSRRAKYGTACTLRGSSSPQKAGFLGTPLAGVSLWELADEQGVPDAPLRGGERRSDGAIRGRLSLTAPNERNQRRRVSEPTLTRMLRHELSGYMKADLLAAIAIVVSNRMERG